MQNEFGAGGGWVRFGGFAENDANGPDGAEIFGFEQAAHDPAELFELRERIASGGGVGVGIDIEGTDIQFVPMIGSAGGQGGAEK